MNESVDNEFTPLQQQQYEQGLKAYWDEPAHTFDKEQPKIQKEAVLVATWHARANVMTDQEFKVLIDDLSQRAFEGGDVGGEFWSRIISNLKELRRLPLKPS